MTRIVLEPLTQKAFAAFGDVISADAANRHFPINNGTTERYHDLGRAVALGIDARVILSIARAQPFALPLTIAMVERHPLGSQAFVPLKPTRFVVVVAPDTEDGPGPLRAFLAGPGQGINFFAGTWHGVLSVLDEQTDFLIVDRDGAGDNLETVDLNPPVTVSE